MTGNAARLATLTRDLFERWQQTQSSWRDRRAAQFEKDYLEELEASTKMAIHGIQNLETILRQVRRDCE